ncbi:MAG: septal ring lytic transglycosylase RlpA family protein [Pseudorhodoplanes sp.]
MFERIVTVSAVCLTVWFDAPPPKTEFVAQPPVLPVPQLVLASFYDEPQLLAIGGKYDPTGLTAAHRTLPFGTRVIVTDTKTSRSVTVTVNDRGPAKWTGRDIDLSLGAAQALQMEERGIILATLAAVPPAGMPAAAALAASAMPAALAAAKRD